MTDEAEQRTKRERFLPYAHQRFGMTCRIERVEIDGAPTGSDVEPDVDRHLVALDDAPWELVTLHGSLAASADTLASVFPKHERPSAPGTTLIVLRGSATRLRRSVVVANAELSPSAVPFTIALRRDDVHGSVELVPFLVRAEDAASATPGYASQRGTRLASGRPWTVRVDRLRDPQGRFLDTRYCRFSEDAELRPYADTLYRLQLSESPVLWINSDHETVQRVFDDRGTRGPKARIREVAFDLIAQSVWTQLFLQAALDLSHGGQLVYEWEDSVLRELLPSIILGERAHAARVTSLRSKLEREELPELLARLATVLQRRNKLVDHLAKLVEETAERRP